MTARTKKTVSVSESAHRELEYIRNKRETYNDVIERLIKEYYRSTGYTDKEINRLAKQESKANKELESEYTT